MPATIPRAVHMSTAHTPAALVGIDPAAPRDSQTKFHIKSFPERFTSAFNATVAAAQAAVAFGVSLPPSVVAQDHLSRAGALPHAPEPPAVAPSIPAELVESWIVMHEIIRHFTTWLAGGKVDAQNIVLENPPPSNILGDSIVEAFVTIESEGTFYNIIIPLKLRSGRRYEFITAFHAPRLLTHSPAEVAGLLATRLLLECLKLTR